MIRTCFNFILSENGGLTRSISFCFRYSCDLFLISSLFDCCNATAKTISWILFNFSVFEMFDKILFDDFDCFKNKFRRIRERESERELINTSWNCNGLSIEKLIVEIKWGFVNNETKHSFKYWVWW